MRGNGLVHTQVTVDMVKVLMKIRKNLEEREKLKKRKRVRITKREVCEELVNRCIIKKVV